MPSDVSHVSLIVHSLTIKAAGLDTSYTVLPARSAK